MNVSSIFQVLNGRPVALRFLAALALTSQAAAVLAQEPANAEADPKAVFPGTIYLMSVGLNDPLRGLAALKPNDSTWRKVSDEWMPRARVSPDGRLFVSRKLVPGVADQALWVFDTSGEKEPVKIFEGGFGVPGGWSADGKEVVLSTRTQDGATKAWRAKVDGSGQQPLPISESELILDWSPDGQWLLTFSGGKPGRAINLIRTDGTDKRALIPPPDPAPRFGGTGFSAHFSPDGRQVLTDEFVFEAGDEMRPKLKSTALMLVDVESGKIRRFFERKAGSHSSSQCWSPDGKAIAVVIVEGAGEPPNLDMQTHLDIVDTTGRVLRTIQLPQPSNSRNIIDWR